MKKKEFENAVDAAGDSEALAKICAEADLCWEDICEEVNIPAVLCDNNNPETPWYVKGHRGQRFVEWCSAQTHALDLAFAELCKAVKTNWVEEQIESLGSITDMVGFCEENDLSWYGICRSVSVHEVLNSHPQLSINANTHPFAHTTEEAFYAHARLLRVLRWAISSALDV